jgi:acyl-CoA reductase-like NAD-dependent aldehyde dehydrogenase
MQHKPSHSALRPSTSPTDDPTMDFRARLEHQQAASAERRKLDLAEQSSRLKTAEERIRIWERLHEVTLPRDPAHRLVDIIAANTGLTDAEVRDEQCRRAAHKSAPDLKSAPQEIRQG